MTVPTLRDIALSRPRNDAEVLAAVPYTIELWIGRAGQTANVGVDLSLVGTDGTVGTPVSKSVNADPNSTGRYTSNLGAVTPWRRYRLRVTAADPGASGDTTTETYYFTTTPG